MVAAAVVDSVVGSGTGAAVMAAGGVVVGAIECGVQYNGIDSTSNEAHGGKFCDG